MGTLDHGDSTRQIPVGDENPPDKENNTQKLAQSLNSFLPNILLEQRVRYDRGAVNDSYPWARAEDGTVTISAPALGKDADEGAKVLHSMEGDFRGTCREIAPAVAKWLGTMGSVKSSEVFGCANDGEYHYCAVGNVENSDGGSGRVLVDLGYSQPVPVAVIVDGGPVESDFYYGEGLPKDKLPKGQAYGGKVLYEAVSGEDGGIVFTIKRAPEGPVIKRFEFKPANEQVDKTIVAGFPVVTGSICDTKVVPAGIVSAKAKIDRTDGGYSGEFGRLYNILTVAKKTNEDVRVVINYK